jgi:hypothetical protein
MNLEVIKIFKQLATDKDIYAINFKLNGTLCMVKHCITKDELYSTFGITEKEFNEKLYK